MQNPERRTEEGTRRNEEIEECLTDTAGGCTEAEKLILPKKALVGTARGNRMHGLRRKRRAASVTFAGDSPHTTACGPTISSEFDIAEAGWIEQCRRRYY